MCVTLNEGYLRSTIRGSNNLHRFLIKIKQISLQRKDELFWSVFFTVFFRLPIYEPNAAIFWESASYVLKMFEFFCVFLEPGVQQHPPGFDKKSLHSC